MDARAVKVEGVILKQREDQTTKLIRYWSRYMEHTNKRKTRRNKIVFPLCEKLFFNARTYKEPGS